MIQPVSLQPSFTLKLLQTFSHYVNIFNAEKLKLTFGIVFDVFISFALCTEEKNGQTLKLQDTEFQPKLPRSW